MAYKTYDSHTGRDGSIVPQKHYNDYKVNKAMCVIRSFLNLITARSSTTTVVWTYPLEHFALNSISSLQPKIEDYPQKYFQFRVRTTTHTAQMCLMRYL